MEWTRLSCVLREAGSESQMLLPHPAHYSQVGADGLQHVADLVRDAVGQLTALTLCG